MKSSIIEKLIFRKRIHKRFTVEHKLPLVFDKDKVKYSNTRQSELKSFDIGDRNNRMVRLKNYLFNQYYKSRHN
jgi:hypothetical protein